MSEHLMNLLLEYIQEAINEKLASGTSDGGLIEAMRVMELRDEILKEVNNDQRTA